MSYNILSIPPFDKQLKRLAKKYPSIKRDFSALLDVLEQINITINDKELNELLQQITTTQ